VCVVYSGEVRGGVGTRSGMCCVGWVVWVQVSGIFYSRLIYGNILRLHEHIHLAYNYIQGVTLYNVVSIVYGRLVDLRLYTVLFLWL